MKTIECPICKLFHDFDYLCRTMPIVREERTIESFISINYSALRDEMIESFTRVANARNWVIVAFIGGITLMGADSFLNNSIISPLIPIVSSILIFLLAHFALNAYSSTWSIGAALLAYEVKLKQHFGNEHSSWSESLSVSSSTKTDFFGKNFSLSLSEIESDLLLDNDPNIIPNFQSRLNVLIENKLEVSVEKKWIKLVFLDFYFWLIIFNILITFLTFPPVRKLIFNLWTDMEFIISIQYLLDPLFWISMLSQFVLLFFVIYFVWLERYFFKIAFLESIFKFIQLKRGINLKLKYPWLYTKLFKVY